jgi:hypothetical protein
VDPALWKHHFKAYVQKRRAKSPNVVSTDKILTYLGDVGDTYVGMELKFTCLYFKTKILKIDDGLDDSAMYLK